MKIFWSDSLVKLADELFDRTAGRRDPFEVECTLVGSAAIAGWLKQHFLYDLPRQRQPQPVLANWNFEALHPFVNDWLARACQTVGSDARRAAHRHPYARGALQWRIWNELLRPDVAIYAGLYRYIGTDAKAVDRRRWGLAGRLAQLFDDYQNDRPDLLDAWERRRLTPETQNAEQAWQPALWQALVAKNPDSYLRQFMTIKKNPAWLEASGIGRTYRRLSVFHVTALPHAYLQFFADLGAFMPVELYLFNPSREFWIDDPTVRQYVRDLTTHGDAPVWLEPPHPLLSGFGRGVQAFLANVLDTADGDVNEATWGDDAGETLLRQVQRNVRQRQSDWQSLDASDDSIQLHVCHSPLREVEVVRDLILKWFDEHPGAQPRGIQVLAPSFETYAPFIEAVFDVNGSHPLIPCVMGKRPPVSAGAVGAAFLRLLRLNDGRMTAPEIVELLELDPIRESCHLSVDEAATLRRLVEAAGIRWGRDGDHINRALETDGLPDTVTWRRGLDRLLAGLALGRPPENGAQNLLQAGALGPLLPFDAVEGDTARLVGVLGQFFDALCETADRLRRPRGADGWFDVLTALLERFFHATEQSFQEIAEIRQAIQTVAESAAYADHPEVSAEVIAAAVEAELGGASASGNCAANAVLFTPLQTMQATPRELIVMMGLNAGAYPRGDERADFDWIGRRPRASDRSLRREDRLAFLECLMSAKQRLILTYTGRSVADGGEIPPSPAVTEFVQALGGHPHETEHKLHAFDPAYFQGDGVRISYSQPNHAAACAWARALRATGTPAETDTPSMATAADAPATTEAAAAVSDTVALTALSAFFVNPAKYYFTQTLQARLADPQRDTLSDCEMFEPNALDVYQANQFLIDAALRLNGALDAETLFTELQERTLLPMGSFGQLQAKRMIADIQTFLSHASARLGLDYAATLRARGAAGSTTASVTVDGAELAGGLPLIHVSGVPCAIHFRYATIKAKDRISAWLAHLVGQASGLPLTTLIIGKKGQGVDEEVIPPLPGGSASAVAILAILLRRYRQGLAALLPFAPESSLAYAQACGGDQSGRSQCQRPEAEGEACAAVDEAGLQAAEKVWDNFLFPEKSDAYLFAAWGEAGPMAHPDFMAAALDFWEPYYQAQSGVDPKTTGGEGEPA